MGGNWKTVLLTGVGLGIGTAIGTLIGSWAMAKLQAAKTA